MIDQAALDTLFFTARTRNGWHPDPVPAETLQAIWDMTRMGPTSANCQPLRIVFVASPAAKERLRPALAPGNVDKTMSAPVTAILGFDLDFPDTMPEVFPHTDARSWFVGKPDFIRETAFRNSTLQAGYFILAARAAGLDCGPMSGFDQAKVDAEFFAGTNIKSNFLCNLGHGTDKDIFPRSPRFAFDRVCTIL